MYKTYMTYDMFGHSILLKNFKIMRIGHFRAICVLFVLKCIRIDFELFDRNCFTLIMSYSHDSETHKNLSQENCLFHGKRVSYGNNKHIIYMIYNNLYCTKGVFENVFFLEIIFPSTISDIFKQNNYRRYHISV